MVFDACPQLFKTVQHRLHRTRVRLLVTVEIHRTVREHGKTGHKAHHCSRKTAEHLRTTVEPAAGRRHHRNRGVDLLIDFAAHSQRTQRVHHQLGIARAQQTDQSHRTMPESRKNEITVRQGFAARHHNGGVKRFAGKRRRPKILLRCVHRAYRIQNPRKTTLQSRHTAPVSCSNSTIKCHPYHFRLKTQADRTMRISQNATRNSRDRRVCTGNRRKDFSNRLKHLCFQRFWSG